MRERRLSRNAAKKQQVGDGRRMNLRARRFTSSRVFRRYGLFFARRYTPPLMNPPRCKNLPQRPVTLEVKISLGAFSAVCWQRKQAQSYEPALAVSWAVSRSCFALFEPAVIFGLIRVFPSHRCLPVPDSPLPDIPYASILPQFMFDESPACRTSIARLSSRFSLPEQTHCKRTPGKSKIWTILRCSARSTDEPIG